MPAARSRLRRQLPVDVEEARARKVPLQVQSAPTTGISQFPAAVDELVAQTYQLPAGEAGSGTDAGWMT
jgi:hypothetical protein